MAVTAKITEMPYIQLANKGPEIKIHDGDSQLGDLYVNKSSIEWCEGNTHRGNGTKIKYSDLNWIAYYNDELLKEIKKLRKRDNI